MSTTQQKNDWIAKSKERITLLVDKGKKEKIRIRAKSLGTSLNSYINDLIEKDMPDGD